jgi:hypothetical protein
VSVMSPIRISGRGTAVGALTRCGRCDRGERRPARRAKLAERRQGCARPRPAHARVPRVRERWLDGDIARRPDRLLNAALAGDVEVATRHFDATTFPQPDTADAASNAAPGSFAAPAEEARSTHIAPDRRHVAERVGALPLRESSPPQSRRVVLHAVAKRRTPTLALGYGTPLATDRSFRSAFVGVELTRFGGHLILA